jgi:hypothetical protein
VQLTAFSHSQAQVARLWLCTVKQRQKEKEMHEITTSDDFINASDLMERVKELSAMPERDEFEEQELIGLRTLVSDLESRFGRGYIEQNNTTLVRESYFEEYARDEAYDMGDVSKEGSVDSYVDWPRYAEAVSQDWAEVDFDGTTYLVRG